MDRLTEHHTTWTDDAGPSVHQVAREKDQSGSSIETGFLLPAHLLFVLCEGSASSSRNLGKIRHDDGSPFSLVCVCVEGELLLTGVYLTHLTHLVPVFFAGYPAAVACDLQSCLPLFGGSGWVDGQFQETRLCPIWVDNDVIRLC